MLYLVINERSVSKSIHALWLMINEQIFNVCLLLQAVVDCTAVGPHVGQRLTYIHREALVVSLH